MKRVRVAPGKFVYLSPDLVAKLEQIGARQLTRDQANELKQSEPRLRNSLMAGSSKPLALSARRAKSK